MKHLKLFENFNEYKNKSKLPIDLYNELLPLFEPSYNLDRPSGYSLEQIEIRFNDKTTFKDVEEIIKDSNWYVVKYYKNSDGDIRRIDIKPTYSKFIETNYPNTVYHISPSSNDESIKKHGLKSGNAKKMGINYPNRIYVVSDLNTLNSFSKELNWYVNEDNWTIWEINLYNLNIDYIYVDETVNQNLTKPTAFYLQDIDIPTNHIKIYDKININTK